jgi:hypothetical protein
MPRLVPASWLWSLIVILGWYTPGGQGPVQLPAGAVHRAAAVDLPTEYLRVAPASLAIEARLRHDPGPETRIGPHPAAVAVPAAALRRSLDAGPAPAVERRRQSCHFPLFPTGPPPFRS